MLWLLLAPLFVVTSLLLWALRERQLSRARLRRRLALSPPSLGATPSPLPLAPTRRRR